MADKIGVIGLGYVGLPLAVEFGKQFSTVGYDINSKRIKELIKGIDHTEETSKRNIKSALKLWFSSDINDLKDLEIFFKEEGLIASNRELYLPTFENN